MVKIEMFPVAKNILDRLNLRDVLLLLVGRTESRIDP
jgi:hypothetical protein